MTYSVTLTISGIDEDLFNQICLHSLNSGSIITLEPQGNGVFFADNVSPGSYELLVADGLYFISNKDSNQNPYLVVNDNVNLTLNDTCALYLTMPGNIQTVDHITIYLQGGKQSLSDMGLSEQYFYSELYSFNGWYIDSQLTQKYDSYSIIDSDLDLYAVWEDWNSSPCNVSISISDVNGTPLSGLDVSLSTNPYIPEKDVRYGLEESNAAGTYVAKVPSNMYAILINGEVFGDIDDSFIHVAGDIEKTLTNVCSVTYDLSEYIGNLKLTYYLTSNKFSLAGMGMDYPDLFINEGYKLIEWYTNNELTEVYDINSPIINNITLYPKLEEAKFEVSISLSDNEGRLTGKQVKLQNTLSNNSITLNAESNGTYIYDDVPGGTYELFIDEQQTILSTFGTINIDNNMDILINICSITLEYSDASISSKTLYIETGEYNLDRLLASVPHMLLDYEDHFINNLFCNSLSSGDYITQDVTINVIVNSYCNPKLIITDVDGNPVTGLPIIISDSEDALWDSLNYHEFYRFTEWTDGEYTPIKKIPADTYYIFIESESINGFHPIVISDNKSITVENFCTVTIDFSHHVSDKKLTLYLIGDNFNIDQIFEGFPSSYTIKGLYLDAKMTSEYIQTSNLISSDLYLYIKLVNNLSNNDLDKLFTDAGSSNTIIISHVYRDREDYISIILSVEDMIALHDRLGNGNSISFATIDLSNKTIQISKSVLSDLIGSSKTGIIEFSIAPVDINAVTESQKSAADGRQIYKITVQKDGNNVSFGNNKIAISVPYELKTGETAGNLAVRCINTDGTYEDLKCSYSNGKVTFDTSEISLFAIIYKQPSSTPSGPSTPSTPTVPDEKPVVKEDEVKNENGTTSSITETTTKKENADGSKETTVEKKEEVKDENGKVQSVIEETSKTTENKDGSKETVVEKKEEVKDESGSVQSVKEEKVSEKVSTDGTVNKTSETTVKDSKGNTLEEKTSVSLEDKTAGITTTAEIKKDADGSVTAETVSKVKVNSEEGKASVSKEVVDAAVQHAEEVKKIAEEKGAAVTPTLEIETSSSGTEAETELPAEALAKLADAEVNVKVKTDVGDIELPPEVAKNLAAKGEEAVSLSIGKADKEQLNDKQKKAVGDSPVFTLSSKAGEQDIHELGGTVKITVPYELKEGENPEKITVWYVDDLGNIVKKNSAYDPELKSLVFETDHFSFYFIAEDTSAADEEKNDNTLYYVLAAVVIIIVLAAAAYFLHKKK